MSAEDVREEAVELAASTLARDEGIRVHEYHRSRARKVIDALAGAGMLPTQKLLMTQMVFDGDPSTPISSERVWAYATRWRPVE